MGLSRMFINLQKDSSEAQRLDKRLRRADGSTWDSGDRPDLCGCLSPQIAMRPEAQLAAGLAGFFGFFGLALTALRGVAGLRLTGLRAATGAAIGSGSGLKNARQPGESCDFLLTMQAVTASTFGIWGPQSRNASPVQACSCSGV